LEENARTAPRTVRVTARLLRAEKVFNGLLLEVVRWKILGVFYEGARGECAPSTRIEIRRTQPKARRARPEHRSRHAKHANNYLDSCKSVLFSWYKWRPFFSVRRFEVRGALKPFSKLASVKKTARQGRQSIGINYEQIQHEQLPLFTSIKYVTIDFG